MANRWDHAAFTRESPAVEAFLVVPNDTTPLKTDARSLWVGGAGDVKVDMVEGGTVTFVAVPAGTLLPVSVSAVYATGTTATNIIALG